MKNERLPVVGRLFISTFRSGLVRTAVGRLIIIVEILFWSVFVIMSAESVQDFIVEALTVIIPPLSAFALSFSKPKISGAMCLAFSIIAMCMFGVVDNPFVFLLMDVPLLIAAITLVLTPRYEKTS